MLGHESALAVLFAGMLVIGSPRGEVSGTGSPAAPPPVALPAPPTLASVPALPSVRFAPASGLDLFVHARRWYYWHAGRWFRGTSYRGPWISVPMARMPAPVLAVPAQFYKAPPGPGRGPGGWAPPGIGKGRGKGHP